MRILFRSAPRRGLVFLIVAVAACAVLLVPGSAFAAPAGFASFESVLSNADGSQDTLAGSHPFQVTTSVSLGQTGARDVHVQLPAGLVGNTNVVAQCTTAEFEERRPGGFNGCPDDTAVGYAEVTLQQAGEFPV